MAKAEIAGAEQHAHPDPDNSECPDALPARYGFTLTDGIWDFQLEGTGSFIWIVVDDEAPLEDHSH